MRTLIFSMVLLVCIVTFALFSLSYLENSSQEMLVQLEKLEKAVLNEEWPETETNLKDVFSHWASMEKKWAMVLNHRETDEIELTMAKLKSYVETEEQSGALAELSSLKFLLLHIPAKEKLQLHNVF